MTSTLIFNGIVAVATTFLIVEVQHAARFLKQVRDDFVLENRSEKRWEGRVLQCEAHDKAKETGFAPSRYYTMNVECRVLGKWPIFSESLKTFR